MRYDEKSNSSSTTILGKFGDAMTATVNQVLQTNGVSADPSWETLSSLLDAVFGSAEGNIFYRGASEWVVLSPSTAGALLQTGGASAAPSWTGPGQIVGTATDDAASVGNIGEYVSSTVAETGGVSLTNGVAINITSISLSPGDWDVWGKITVDQGSGNDGNLVNLAGTISDISENIVDYSQGVLGTCLDSSTKSGAMRAVFNLSTTRFSLNATTTIYLVARANYANISLPGTGFGTIAARRAR
ncbi:MAG: hypothetical protein ACREE1_20370 [Stellaceae bacterium]